MQDGIDLVLVQIELKKCECVMFFYFMWTIFLDL